MIGFQTIKIEISNPKISLMSSHQVGKNIE
jgi:hypothetical protein